MHNETIEFESVDAINEELHKLCKELRDALMSKQENIVERK